MTAQDLPGGGGGEGRRRQGVSTTVHVVHDYTPAASAWCLKWIGEDRNHRLCCRKPGHPGGCIPLPRFPRQDVSDDNPRYVPSPRSAAE